MDVVLQHGWAYGEGGDALAGKRVLSVVTTGGPAEAYCPQGHNHYTMNEFLRPLEQTARLCGMDYETPLIFHGALHMDEAGVAAAVRRYRDALAANED